MISSFVDGGTTILYRRVAGVFETHTIIAGHNLDIGDNLGTSVAISANTVILGAPLDDDAKADAGTAVVLEVP